MLLEFQGKHYNHRESRYWSKRVCVCSLLYCVCVCVVAIPITDMITMTPTQGSRVTRERGKEYVK